MVALLSRECLFTALLIDRLSFSLTLAKFMVLMHANSRAQVDKYNGNWNE